MKRPENLDQIIQDVQSLVDEGLNSLPFGASDLQPVLEYLAELETVVKDLTVEDRAFEQRARHTTQRVLRQP